MRFSHTNGPYPKGTIIPVQHDGKTFYFECDRAYNQHIKNKDRQDRLTIEKDIEQFKDVYNKGETFVCLVPPIATPVLFTTIPSGKIVSPTLEPLYDHSAPI